MNKKRLFNLVGIFLVLGMLFALIGCAPAPAGDADMVAQLEEQLKALQAELDAAKTGGDQGMIDDLTKQLEDAKALIEGTPKVITVWSHFANEPAARDFIQGVFDDYMAANPNVKIEVAWFDKEPLRQSIQTVMQSGGEGAPDMTTFDTYDVSWVQAGWLEPLDDVLDPALFVPGAVDDGRYPDLGFPEAYKFNFAFTIDYILFNREIFEEVGVTVPDDFQFTQDEFLEVVKKCNDGGYAGFANGAGNRPFPGAYISKAAVLSLVGPEEFNKLWMGQQSWDSPEVRQALDWVVELGDAGLWHDSFATMTLDEAHLYFHTQRKACMFMNGSWYPNRAFKPEADGGQSPDFQFGMLKYPKMDGATAPNSIVGLFPTGYVVLSSSENKEISKDILKFWSEDPSYGAKYSAITNAGSAIRFTADDVPEEFKDNPWQWYWDEFNLVYGEIDPVVPGAACGDFNDEATSVLNQGIPLGLVTVDEAIQRLDAKLCE